MNKIDVMTFKGVLKYLEISNRTFYTQYRPYLKACGTQGNALLYKVSDVDKRKKEIEEKKIFNEKFNIVQ